MNQNGSLYTVFVLLGQLVATLLGRLHFNKCRNSTWLYRNFLFVPTETSKDDHDEKPRFVILVLLYTYLSVYLTAPRFVFNRAVLNFLVSTYSLFCTSQSGFIAVLATFFFLSTNRNSHHV